MTHAYKQTHILVRGVVQLPATSESQDRKQMFVPRESLRTESLSLSLTYTTGMTHSLVKGHGKGAPETYIISSVLPVSEVLVTGEKNPKPSRRQANQPHTYLLRHDAGKLNCGSH